MTKIMIIGCGVVGQANGEGLAVKGHDIIYVDKDPRKIESLRQAGHSAYLDKEILHTGMSVDHDICLVCVSTPFVEDSSTIGFTDLSPLKSAIVTYSQWLRTTTIQNTDRGNGHSRLLVIRSTVPPGTTKNVVLPLLELHSGMKVGQQLGLCVQPEFVRSSSAPSDFLNARATIIGEFDKSSGDTLWNLFRDFGGRLIRTDLETAEFMKFVHNSFNATKISFANEMWLLGKRIGVDANAALRMAAETAEGFWNPKYGIRGGEPYSGRCLPKDLKAFLAFAKGHELVDMPLLSAVDSVNSCETLR
jgi:UDPglucose 6-dehydrogenase